MKKGYIAGAVGVSVLLAGCFGEDPPNPEEEALVPYLLAWQDGSYEAMDGVDADLAERYELIYGDLQAEVGSLDFDARDFEEEDDIDLGEIQEIDYSVSVSIETLAGELNYDTTVPLERTEDEDGPGDWEAVWQPDHLLPGMQAEDDSIRVAYEEPVRGEIMDRNDEPIAQNGEVYEAAFVPESAEDLEASTEAFADVMELDADAVYEAANQYPDNPDWAAPVQLVAYDDPRVEELLEIDGVLLNTEEGRQYPLGRSAGHLAGHIGPITGEELEEVDDYPSDADIGKYGIEYFEEETLRGERGVEVRIVDASDEVREVIQSEQPVDGDDITLTIDSSYQELTAGALEGESGAAVLLDADTGETLALTSGPSFDSNLRYLELPDPTVDELDTVEQLFEQRFRQAYSPGSIFKPVTAAIGLNAGTLDPEAARTIEGDQWQQDESWGGFEITRVNDSVTEVDLDTAMALSDNIYFAQEALDLGADTMLDGAEAFGFGESWDYPLPLQEAQLANDDTIDEDILLADTGYGQGQVLSSPVHMAGLYTTFTDGAMTEPVLLMDDEAEASQPLEEETLGIIRDTLASVVQDPDGTAYREDPGHDRDVIGKTGTAELKSEQTVEDGDQIGWFASLDEEYVLVVMLQDADSGEAVDVANAIWSGL
ncbi:penicillin-binding transpeptidase domain-containing protein [Alkalicoccus chagannorensis]|uniref:penicillin-binding transpeptidase domain-containing protein n=1 Tax=Alkalicoccus chagannorensis TaxID=427072 RepID=UPI0004219704|nr:penicillin-binding transpeptidase domain-containing protein [Alkalicoccus chagannorensis]